ncbi:MAG: hypothetical protein K2X35_26070 [Bryobacteraceae bacterium]|nr:hypothetical protein [Bryobacteraceae bacterium]
MKKPYQIESARAVQRFQKMTGKEMPPVQLMMPMTEIASMIQRGTGELMRDAGMLMIHAVMEAEVQKLVGDRHQQGRSVKAIGGVANAATALWTARKSPLRERECEARISARSGSAAMSCSSGISRSKTACGGR